MAKYYIDQVDQDAESIYCHHDHMGESYIPEHFHKKGQFLVTEGGIVYVKTSNCTYFLPARHYLWIPAGTSHSIHPSSPEVIMRNLYFPVYKNDSAFFHQEGIYPVDKLLLELLLFTQQWNGNLQPETSEYHIAKGLKYLLPKLSPHKLTLALPVTTVVRLQTILEYIQEHLDENLLFSHVAETFGFSPRSLYRLFQSELKMSFIQYYTLARMLKAIELLVTKKYSISEVASAVGYNSIPTFSNTFQSIMGKRPSEYMKG